MNTKIVKFYAKDGIELDGYINKCDINTEKILIQIHGMSSNCFRNRDKIIANRIKDLNIDTLCFNNRGSDIVRYAKNKNGVRIIAGTAYEDIADCYFDIVGAIEYVISLGYKTIYLQGHSLGATKTVYCYNKLKNENSQLLKYIKGIILLSLVDIPDMLNTFTPKQYIEYANKLEAENNTNSIMPIEGTLHPISVKTFLRYVKYNKDIDFARYHDINYNFKELYDMDIPIFMRWGNNKELIKQDAKELVNILNEKLKDKNTDINYIDGANHSYTEKEEILAEQIYNFLNK